MRGKARGGWIVVALALSLGGCSVFGGKAAPEPAHRVVLKDDAIELREYDRYAVAWTTARGGFDEAVGTGFRRLFDYITGGNLPGSDIAMTAPVLTEPRRNARETPPSGLAGAGIEAWSTGFILPPGYTGETAPPPTGGDISVVDVEKSCVASIRFAGVLDNEAAEAARRALAGWIEERRLDHAGDWKAAGYNPPWTIPSLRRNEVLVTLRSC